MAKGDKKKQEEPTKKKSLAHSVRDVPKRAKVVTSKKERKAGRVKDDFRSAFLASLQAKKEDLEETLAGLLSSRKEYNGELTAGDYIDEVDDAQREISASSHYGLIERKNRELRKVEHLLGRILKEEEFGLCDECGARIPRERLMAAPEATLCIACQREMEKEDYRRLMASKSTLGFGPRREFSWGISDSRDDDENVMVEYHIGTVPTVDIDEIASDDQAPKEKEEPEGQS